MHNKITENLLPLEKFWNDQNQKLLANDGFLNEFGDLFDDVLFFHHEQGKTTLDFSSFDLNHINIESPATLTLFGKQYPLTLKEYAKLLVINNISLTNTRNALPSYAMIKHIAAFLNNRQERALTPENIELFHVSFLTQSVTETRWVTRLSPPSHGATYNNFHFQNAQQTLYALGVKGIIDARLTKREIDKTLDNACRSIMSISRIEYRQGGSFNSLTLDIGQYYVDHLKRVYEDDYLLTQVCHSAIKALYSQEGFIHDRKRLIFILDTILGNFIIVQNRPGLFTRNNIHNFLKSELFNQYEIFFDKVQSVKQANITTVLKELGLLLRFDAIEVVRVLMLQRYYSFNSYKTADDVWRDYIISLDKSEIENKTFKNYTSKDVYLMMEKVISKQKLTKKNFYSTLSKWAKGLVRKECNIVYKDLKAQLDRVFNAMTSLIVAYTGYRKSEFGFPLSAINVQPNLDLLDNSHIPFRFILKWTVPKTGGPTKITREIPSQCYQIAAQLNDAHGVSEGSPCLYSDYTKIKAGQQTPHESDTYIDTRVQSNWIHFVKYYTPFVSIRELERLSKLHKDDLSKKDISQLSNLRQNFELTSARGRHLLAASKETLEGLTCLECIGFTNTNKQRIFKKSLVEYQNTGEITNEKIKKLITGSLSDETKAWLLSEGCHLDKKAVKDITNELTSEICYPTAHAFRHIWAESVLMRYQGDIGAVIQHQFCHLDPSFFMAYLRNKEAKHLMQAARMKVLNSIVDTLLCDTDKIGKEYVGGFSLFVKKAASLVETVSDNEVRALRDRIAGRVISIQPSRFATCVPREGAESRAKCAEMGEINPHNAKPSFCLGCTNSIITSGNIAGIWATIQPFVKECLNEDIMGFMVESHLDTLHSANRRIKELAPSVKNSSMDKILFYINEAIKSVERKLEAEKGLYE